jgi:hypothetical protein
MADEDDRTSDITLNLARARLATGDARTARPLLETILERALQRGDLVGAVQVADDLESTLYTLGEAERAVTMISDLRSRLGQAPSLALAELIALEAGHDTATMLDAAGASIAMTEGLGLPPSPWALAYRGAARIELGDPEGEVDVDGGVRDMLRQGRTQGAFLAAYNAVMSLAAWSPRRAVERLEGLIELAETLGAQASLWESRALRLQTLSYLGRFDEVDDEVDGVVDWARASGNAFACAIALRALAAVDRFRGGSRVSLEEFERVERGAFGPRGLYPVAELAHARGEDDLARALLVEAASADGSRSWAVPLAVELGLIELAEGMIAHPPPGPAVRAAERLLAEAAIAGAHGRTDMALEGYATAAAAFRDLGMLPDEALASGALGGLLVATGDRAQASARLRASRELWVTMGATPRVAEIDEILRSRVEPPPD